MELTEGQVCGVYQIGPKLSKGAMSVTYGAIHTDTRDRYALKLMFGADAQFLERLKRGGEAQKSLVHENLVHVAELTEIDEVPTLVMEYVHGTSLDRWLREPHPLAESMALFKGMVRGVGHAHKAGIVHRNIKTEKILVDMSGPEPSAKVNDFMLVKLDDASGGQLTQLGVSFGTPQYMAPEQFRDVSSVDERADLFALGCILYEMTCGRRAFEGTEIIEIYTASATGDYPPPKEIKPNLPDRIDRVLVSLLEVDVGKRPQSCDELYDLLYGDGELAAEVAAAGTGLPGEVRTVVPKDGTATPADSQRVATPESVAEESTGLGVSPLLFAALFAALALLFVLASIAIALLLLVF